MFLFARHWTSQMVMALLASDVPWPTAQEWNLELIQDLGLVIPITVVVGQLCMRLATTWSVPKPLRKSVPIAIWTFVLQWLVADLTLAIILWSVSGRLQEEGPILEQSFLWKESMGWNGPFLIFICRMIMAGLGLNLGEKFFPLALTGGIACGKSTVSKILREKGGGTEEEEERGKPADSTFFMIDADKIGHQILLPPWHEDLTKPGTLVGPADSVYVKILETFAEPGDKVDDKHSLLDSNKCIDRTKLGARIFGKEEERHKLNQITHMRIFKVLLKNMTLAMYTGKAAWVCAEIPLLFESGPMKYIFGLILCVACSPQHQMERLQKRNPELTPQDCQQRIDSQMPLKEKIEKADIVIWNVYPLDKDGKPSRELEVHIHKICRQLKERAYGLTGTSFCQFTLFFFGFVVVAESFRFWLHTPVE